MGRSKRKERHGRGFGEWPPYVPVAERRREAARKVQSMTKKGEHVSPVKITGRAIATTFWGKAWCENLESYMDYENRLPRGRTYVRNGSVVDLQITPGKVKARVSGSSLYTVEITIKAVEPARWQGVIKSCAGKIDSLVELLQGKLSKGVMETVTSREQGLFPDPKQISMKCSCPDWATMCKHVAATLYGVGSRLDEEPELLFRLRQVDHMELITKASTPAALKTRAAKGKVLETADLGSMFGIEIDAEEPAPSVEAKGKRGKAVEAAPRRVAAVKSAGAKGQRGKAVKAAPRKAAAKSKGKSSKAKIRK